VKKNRIRLRIFSHVSFFLLFNFTKKIKSGFFADFGNEINVFFKRLLRIKGVNNSMVHNMQEPACNPVPRIDLDNDLTQ